MRLSESECLLIFLVLLPLHLLPSVSLPQHRSPSRSCNRSSQVGCGDADELMSLVSHLVVVVVSRMSHLVSVDRCCSVC